MVSSLSFRSSVGEHFRMTCPVVFPLGRFSIGRISQDQKYFEAGHVYVGFGCLCRKESRQ